MFSTIDKAWVAGVVGFICQYVLQAFFNITVDGGVQDAIVNLAVTFILPAIAVWAWPNKKPKVP